MERFARLEPWAHNAFRIVYGFAFFTHGAAKLFGWFGGHQVGTLWSRYTLAGIIEVTTSILIALGFRTRVAAFIASGEMAVAYFWIHVTDNGSLWHWKNHGEFAMLFCFGFFLLAALGSGSFSLDAWLARRRS